MDNASILPDVYCDQYLMAISPYGVTMTFAKSQPPTKSGGPPTPDGTPGFLPQAIIRMSLEHAKVLVMLIRKQIKEYEIQTLKNPIQLPPELLKSLKLEEAIISEASGNTVISPESVPTSPDKSGSKIAGANW